MKRLPLFALAALAAMAQGNGPKSVYVLPMALGFDQHLAEQLTREHVLTVVADPKTADVVLTDRLGEGFEARMAKIHPRDEDEDEDAAAIHPSFRSSGNTGTLFLVDSKSLHVVWSDYEKRPRRLSAGNLNREAARVARKIRESLGK